MSAPTSPDADRLASVRAALPALEAGIYLNTGSVGPLPAEYREVIVLREIEGMSYAEIAAVVEVPAGTVMSRLSRARRRLQEALNPAAPRGGG